LLTAGEEGTERRLYVSTCSGSQCPRGAVAVVVARQCMKMDVSMATAAAAAVAQPSIPSSFWRSADGRPAH